uniref:Uncharacterized protein n=1 Tax=Anguilla anguilla TaxID=7936 RepID=A0A0E9X4S6_ANGAN
MFSHYCSDCRARIVGCGWAVFQIHVYKWSCMHLICNMGCSYIFLMVSPAKKPTLLLTIAVYWCIFLGGHFAHPWPGCWYLRPYRSCRP